MSYKRDGQCGMGLKFDGVGGKMNRAPTEITRFDLWVSFCLLFFLELSSIQPVVILIPIQLCMSMKMLPGGFNKKRKLQDEQFRLPSPTKHNFREQSYGSEQDPEVKLLSKCTDKGKTSLESTNEGSEEHMESVTGSNSFNGESDSDSSLYEDIYELQYSEINSCNQYPSTSSGSCSSKNFRNINCFLNRISIKKLRNEVDRKLNPVNLKVALPYEPAGSRDSEMHLSENDEIEQCSYVDMEDMMADTNEANPNSYVLSSGRWAIKTDTRFSNMKPTIDKEFEQYFSMLML